MPHQALYRLLGIALALFSLDAGAWWHEDWSFRKKITLNAEPAGVPGMGTVSGLAIPIRLHSGNFSYFLDTRDDGGDLRVVAGDDQSPLPFHLESYDPITGVGVLWVRAPGLGSSAGPQSMYMYYGAPEAAAGGDAAATYDAAQSAVFHFQEREGPPRDATGYANHPSTSTLGLNRPGVLDRGAQLDGDNAMVLPGNPLLSTDAAGGFSFSTWLLIDDSAASGVLLSQSDAQQRFELGLRNALPYVRLGDAELAPELVASTPLAVGRWQHLALTLDDGLLRLYLDGREVGAMPAGRPPAGGALVLGAPSPGAGLVAGVDETRFAATARSPAWVAAAYETQSADSRLYTFFEDEAAEAAGLASAYLQLLRVTLNKLSLDGWTIIGIILLLGLVSADVMIGKALALARTEKADRHFLGEFRTAGARELEADLAEAAASQPPKTARGPRSALRRLYLGALGALRRLRAEYGEGPLPPQAVEALRSAVDIHMVEELNRMQSRMVMVTIAVSGGPFLGLLGTVLGVMITFTSVAASGEVNVTTIAPGVASAMATTVMGLVIAIPSMFGYNYLATRASRMQSMMEVFSEQLVTQLAALGGLRSPQPQAASHAP